MMPILIKQDLPVRRLLLTLLTSAFLAHGFTDTLSAQGFGGSGREIVYGFGDTTPGLRRQAETFGFVDGTFSGHVGIDIAAPAGTPVYAAAAGEVTSPGPATQAQANEVVIYGAAATDQSLTSYEFLVDIQVVAGERVRAGQLIGFISPTHDELGGPHLHFGIADARGAKLFNPLPFLVDARGAVECVDPERGLKSARDGGYETNRVRRVRFGSLDKPAPLFPVGCASI